MITFDMLNRTQGFDPIILLIVAIITEAIFAGFPMVFKFVRHPVVIIGALIQCFDDKLNRDNRSNVDRAFRGALVVVVIVVLSTLIGWIISQLSLTFSYGWAIEWFLLSSLLAARALFDAVQKVARALNDHLEAGRQAVSKIVGRDPDQLDRHGVARAAIETLAENFSDGFVAPVFWYVLFGLPGLLVYKAVNTMDSMIGHMSPKYRAFGMTAARLDDVLNLIPARLAGLFICLAALFTPTCKPWNALKIMIRDAGKHRSMNAGWPEAAMAGALGIALAGPRRYPEYVVDDPWVGDGSARATEGDIGRALYVYIVACLINMVWLLAIALIRFSLV